MVINNKVCLNWFSSIGTNDNPVYFPCAYTHSYEVVAIVTDSSDAHAHCSITKINNTSIVMLARMHSAQTFPHVCSIIAIGF